MRDLFEWLDEMVHLVLLGLLVLIVLSLALLAFMLGMCPHVLDSHLDPPAFIRVLFIVTSALCLCGSYMVAREGRWYI